MQIMVMATITGMDIVTITATVILTATARHMVKLVKPRAPLDWKTRRYV